MGEEAGTRRVRGFVNVGLRDTIPRLFNRGGEGVGVSEVRLRETSIALAGRSEV